MITIDDKNGEQKPQGGDGSGDTGNVSKSDVEQLINDKVNAAMSTHLTRFKQSFSKDLEGQFAKLLGPIGEQMKGLADAVSKKEEEHEERSSKKSKEDPWQAELAKATAKIKELEEKNRQAEEMTTKERNARLRDEERSLLTRVLQERGVEGAKLRAATALLYTEEQKIVRTEDGKVAFKVQKPGYDDFLEVDKGIEEWLKSDEGKEFLPAKAVGGSGAGPAKGGGKQANGKMTIPEAKMALAEALGVVPKSGA